MNLSIKIAEALGIEHPAHPRTNHYYNRLSPHKINWRTSQIRRHFCKT
ncbi:hypothetical protein QSH61_02075 [Pseudoalteromonas sp. JC3]|nr:hypothetical protein [Pseudoalteromonas sp. JC3]WJE10604.1 hypothetical protein QSH61_02075 [Pseudoalteromonas sp. JC3]